MFSILGWTKLAGETRNTKGDNFLVLFIGERYLENFKKQRDFKKRRMVIGGWRLVIRRCRLSLDDF